MTRITFPAQVVLKTTPKQMSRQILMSFKKSVQYAFITAKPAILRQVRPLVRTAIEISPEYQSMVGGTLKGELGLANPAELLKTIIDQIIASMEISSTSVRVVSGKIKGRFSVKILLSNYSDLLALPTSSLVSFPSGEEVSWLRWLLLAGDRIIIRDFEVEFNLTERQKQHSRSGEALMVRRGSWRVPPVFSGTSKNNFLTRSLDVVDQQIVSIIWREIVQRIK